MSDKQNRNSVQPPQTHFIHLKNTVLTPDIQTYISSAIQHITSLYAPLSTVKEEKNESKEDSNAPDTSKNPNIDDTGSQKEELPSQRNRDGKQTSEQKKDEIKKNWKEKKENSKIKSELSNAKKKVISFLPQRNGILLIGFEDELVDIIWKWVKQMDRVVGKIRVDVDLVLLESHRMTSGFKY